MAVRFAGRAPTLGSALTVAAFNFGTAAGSWIAGLSLDSHFGAVGPTAVGTVIAATTLIPTTAIAVTRGRRPGSPGHLTPSEGDHRMLGVVMHTAGDVRVQERDEPRIIDPTDAVIRLSATCICGSDLWPYRGVEPVDHTVMGHEYCGVVEQVGSDVQTLKPGDFVVGSFVISDNTCEICQAGYQSKCVHAQFVHGTIGTQAERARPHADGTLVKTRNTPTTAGCPRCWPPPTCSAPAGLQPSPPTPAPAKRSPSSATEPSG